MNDFSEIQGVRLVGLDDLPAALRDLIAQADTKGYALAELPPGLDGFLGEAGLTVVFIDDRPTPVRRRRVKDIVQEIERIGRDLAHFRDSHDRQAAHGAAELLRLALVDLVAAGTDTRSEARAKAACLRTHLEASAMDPLGRAMVEAGLRVA